jgi:glycine cleavage system H protein
VKTASDIYSPVSGEVTAVNEKLANQPALVNTAPYGDGWFFQVKLGNPAEVNSLLSADSYKAQIA